MFTSSADSTQACLLIDSSNGAGFTAGSIAHTGLDLTLPLAISAGLVVLGVTILLATTLVRRRRDRRTRSQRSTIAAIAVVAVLSASVLGQFAPGASSAHADADAASSYTTETDGCALIGFSVTPASSDLNTLIDGIPRETMTVAVTNLANLPIDVTFSTQLLDQVTDFASHVDITGICDCQPTPVVQTILSVGSTGSPVRLAAGATISISVNAAIVGDADQALQTAQTSFTLAATAMEIH